MWEVRQRIELMYRSKGILPSGPAGPPDRRPQFERGLRGTADVPQRRPTICAGRNPASGADVVILDPLYLCALAGTDAEASNVFQMGTLLRDMEELILHEGATPIFLHHFNKKVTTGANPNWATWPLRDRQSVLTNGSC